MRDQLWRCVAFFKAATAFCYAPGCRRWGRYPLERLYDGKRVWLCFFHRPMMRTMQRREFKRICREGEKHVY